MKIIRRKGIDLYASDERYKEHLYDEFENKKLEGDTKWLENEIIRTCVNFAFYSHSEANDSNLDYKRFVEVYEKLNGLSRWGILDAHGDDEDIIWKYHDKGQEFKVQDWIDEHDGKYSLLILSVCNSHALEIKSKKSLVLSPNNVVAGWRLDFGHVKFELYVPRKGYINSYTFDAELKRLEKRLERMEK